ncbi:hypothetical protein ACHAW5_008553 [Stephanodiscus triporus]|uniref:Uncharacterized protein n=1 Tax=Stephanodiscus triporus TaxID=2934178 RepID=A0ABD3NR48_9STRA
MTENRYVGIGKLVSSDAFDVEAYAVNSGGSSITYEKCSPFRKNVSGGSVFLVERANAVFFFFAAGGLVCPNDKVS